MDIILKLIDLIIITWIIFLSPIYPIFGFGFDYHASNHLTIDISPFTAKSTIVLDDSLS